MQKIHVFLYQESVRYQQPRGIIKLFTFETGENSDLWLLTHPDLMHVERIKLVMQHLAKSFAEEKSNIAFLDICQFLSSGTGQQFILIFCVP